MSDIILNEGQQEAVKQIQHFIENDSNKPFFTLSGAGGSGKTETIKHALKKYKDKRIIGGAISNSASSILSKSLNFGEIMTTTKLLNKKRKVNSKTGEISFETTESDDMAINKAKIIPIDECSMIDNKDLDDMLYYKKKDAKLIFLGDIAQICPINSDIETSKTFIDGGYYELTQIMRSVEPLTEFTTYIRNQILDYYKTGVFSDAGVISKKMIFPDTKIGDNGYFMLNYEEDLIDKFIDLYKQDISNPMNVKITAYKNKTVDSLNKKIREKLFPYSDYLYSIGDNLITNSYYNKDNNVFKSNEYIVVTKVRKEIDENNMSIYKLDFKNQKQEQFYNISVIDTEKGYQPYIIKKNTLLRQAQQRKISWTKYFNFIEGYLNVSYSFCSTAHRIQGQTINNIFVMEQEIKSVAPISMVEKMQSIYVGQSRAKHKIYML